MTLISKEALLKKQCVYYDYNGEKKGVVLVSDIVTAPEKKSKPKRGEWLLKEKPGLRYYQCSECGNKFPIARGADWVKKNYCSSCGADMRQKHEKG